MNRIAYLLLISLIAGCTKEISTLNNDLQGTWELKRSLSGWGGSVDYTTGNGNTISFNGNAFIQQIKTADTTYTIQGSFSVHKGKPCDFAQEQRLIKMNDDQYENNLTITNKELSIGATECIADGSTSIYRKISD